MTWVADRKRGGGVPGSRAYCRPHAEMKRNTPFTWPHPLWVALLGALSIASVVRADDSGWREFHSQSAGFRAELPAEPQLQYSEDLTLAGKVLHYRYIVEHPAAHFDLERFDLPTVAVFFLSVETALGACEGGVRRGARGHRRWRRGDRSPGPSRPSPALSTSRGRERAGGDPVHSRRPSSLHGGGDSLASRGPLHGGGASPLVFSDLSRRAVACDPALTVDSN